MPLPHAPPAAMQPVPAPDAKVDLIWAWERALTDEAAYAFLLNTDPSIETLFAANRNKIDWFRFMAAQHPRRDRRPRYAATAARWEATFRELEAQYTTQQRRSKWRVTS